MTRHPTRWMALAVGAVVATLAVVLALQVDDDPRAAANHSRLIGKRAPSFALPTLDGGRVRLAELTGKTVVVNFWNSWCIPCRQEHDALVAFHQEHVRDRDVLLVGIVREDTDEAVRAYVAENDVEWTIARDPGAKAAVDFGTRGQPETYVIGPTGVIVAAQYGPVTVGQLDAMVARAQGAA